MDRILTRQICGCKGKRGKERACLFFSRKLHAFINSLIMYLLSIFHKLNTVLDTGDSAMNKTKNK